MVNWRRFAAPMALVGLALAGLAIASAASATTVYVDDSYPSDAPASHRWTTIQKGIDDAAPGDTVLVYNGTYGENVTISNNSVSLGGESRDGVILQPASSSIASVEVRSSGVRISNLSISGGGYSVYASGSAYHNGTVENVTGANSSYPCIYIASASDWTLHDNSLSNCGSYGVEFTGSTTYNSRIWAVNISGARSHGIYLSSASGGSVQDVAILEPAGYGVYLYYSSDLSFENIRLNSSANYVYGIYGYASDFVRLTNSTIELSGPYAYGGLYFDQSRFWTLRGNTFSNQSSPIVFNYNSIQAPYFSHDADASNTVNGLSVLWIVNATAGSWNGSYGWIALVNSSNISVTSTSPLSRNTEGVLLVGTDDSVVHNVNSTANQYGLRAWLSHRNSINDSQFPSNLNGGLYLWRSNGNHINRVTLRPDTPNADYGLSLADTSNNNTVESTDCEGFYYCIYAEYLTNDLFVANSTINASSYGLLSYSQFGPWVSGTTITNSSYAVYLYGYYYYGYNLANFSVSNSTFVGNSYAVSCYYCQGGLMMGNRMDASSYGIYLYYASGIVIRDNTVSDSTYVLYFTTSADSNEIYHNNFYLSDGQTLDTGSSNAYDNGYPSGGNYWSNTSHTDLYSGAAQGSPGSDGINDTAAILNYGKRDNYPLSEPWPPYVSLVSPANGSVIRAGTTLDLNISYYFDTVQYAFNNGTTYNLTGPWDISTGGLPDGALFVQVWANDSWYNLTFTFLFVVDSTAPIMVLDGPPTGGTYPVGTQLNFTVSDPHLAANVTLDNGTGARPFTAPWDVTTAGWAEGDYNVTIIAWDTAGNSRTSVFLFRLDSTPPVISLTSPSNNSVISVGTLIDINVTDVHLTNVTWNNGSADNPLFFPFDISTAGWSGGTYNITVRANDSAGFTTTRVFTFIIDATPPTIGLVSPLNNSVFDPGQILDFDVADANLLAVTWSNGTGTFTLTAPYNISTAGWADGPYNITITANDTAGNVATYVAHFEVDSIAPTVGTLAPLNNSFVVGGTLLDFAVNDTHLFSVTWTNGSGTNSLTSPFDVSTTGWSEATYVVWVNATDSVGHRTNFALFVTIDSTLPQVTLNPPVSYPYLVQGTLLNFSITDTHLNTSRVDWTIGGPATSFGVMWNISTSGWADGAYTVTINASDFAGNLRVATFAFTVDSTLPAIAMVSPTNGSYVPSGRVLNFTISDANLNTSLVNWSNGGAASAFSVQWNISTSAWADGTFTVTVRATDRAGTLATAIFQVTIDSLAPSIGLVTPADNSFLPSGRVLNFTISDVNLNASAVNWSNGGPPTGFSVLWNISTGGWADGTFTVTVRAADLAGNAQTAVFRFTIDSTSPTIVLVSPASGAVVRAGTAINLSINDTNLRNVTYERVLGANTTGQLAFSTNFTVDTSAWPDGDYSVAVRADDAAGNAVNLTVAVTIDSTAPSISLVAPLNGSVVRAGVPLQFNISELHLVTATWNNGSSGDRTFGVPTDVPTVGWTDLRYNVTVVALDAAGNTVTRYFTIDIDSTLPQVLLLSPGNNSWARAGAVIDFGINDAHLANVTVSGAPTGFVGIYDLNTSTWGDGAYSLTVRAEDAAGNNATITVGIRIDSTPPTISVTPGGGSFIKAGITLNFSIVEANLQRAQWRIPPLAFGPFSSNFTLDSSSWSDGNVTVEVNAMDFAGNAVTRTFNFTVDSTPPTVQLLAPLNTTYLRSAVAVDLYIVDANPMPPVIKINSVDFGPVNLGGGYYRLDLTNQSEGNLQLYVNSTDRAGNSATLSVLFVVDDTSPSLPVTLPMSFAGNEDGNFTFTGSAIDNLVTPDLLNFSWSFDTGKRTQAIEVLYGNPATFIFTEPGNYNVELTVTDPAGNPNATNFTISILDVTPPNLTIITKLLNATEDIPLYLNQSGANATDNGLGNLTWVWSVPGTTVSSTGANITWLFIDPGLYNITLRVIDPQNNTAQGYILVTVRDVTPPNVSIIGPSVVDVFLNASYLQNVTDNDRNATAANWNFTWVFIRLGANVSVVYGQSAVFRPNMSGDHTVRLIVTDKSGNEGRAEVTLRVNLPPIVISSPPTEANSSAGWGWTPDVIDPEGQPIVISVTEGPSGMTTDGTSVSWTPPPGVTGPQNVTISFSDGITTVYRSFSIFVVDPAAAAGNHLPVFVSEPPTDARVSTDYLYDIIVTDADGDPITITITGLEGAFFNPVTNRVRWTPPWQPLPNERFERAVAVKITAFDGKQVAAQEFTIRFRNPPNIWPQLIGSFSIGDAKVGDSVYVNLAGNWTDRDDELANLTFAINDTDPALRLAVAKILRWHVDLADPLNPVLVIEIIGPGAANFNFVARDPSGGKSDNAIVAVNAAVASPPQLQQQLPWWLWLVLALGGAGAAVGVAVALRRSRSAASVAQTALETAAKAPTERVIVQQMPAAEGAAGPKKDTFLIEGVFVIYQDGRMVYSKTDIGNVKLEDPELVASMFSAVQSFIKDSFQQQGELNRLGFGDNTILIERGAHVFMASIVFGEPTKELADAMRDTIRTIENAYAGIIEDWDGSTTSLEAIEQYLLPFLALTAHLARPDVEQALKEKGVKMLSELEFFQGFVRLKCGVKNDTDSVITKVTVSIDFNEDVLRLHHVEPETYKRQGSEVQLGVLNPGEKVSVAYYFDPQICTESQIDGIARYRDAKGQARSITMKTRKAEVVCPIFFTKEHANTAMLKRLVEGELDQRDSKVFTVKDKPAATTWQELFGLVKDVVLSHDVHLVREFLTDTPFHGEAWFYGETKVKGYKIVIRASLLEEGQRIEYFAASTVIPAITGLLAEFNHTLLSMIGKKFSTVKLEPEYGDEVKEEIRKKSLMAQMGESELEGGETEQNG